MQRKMDEMWERQLVERENAKLLSKYETESALQNRLNEMGNKIVGLESEIKHLNSVRDALMSQGDEMRNRLQE